MLTKERERELIQRWQQDRDETAFNEAMAAFEPTIKRWSFRKPSPDDAAQTCRMAFLHAMNTFDLDAGTRLSTHFIWQIRGHIASSNNMYSPKIRVSLVDVLNRKTPTDDGDVREYIDTIIDANGCKDSPSEYINAAMHKLKPRHRTVITARMHGFTLDVIGSELGVTRERIRQIEADAINKLRGYLPASIVLYLREEPSTPSGMTAMFNG